MKTRASRPATSSRIRQPALAALPPLNPMIRVLADATMPALPNSIRFIITLRLRG